MRAFQILVVAFLLTGFLQARAQTTSAYVFAINGYLAKSGTPVASGESHSFILWVLDSSSSCVVYQESQTYTFTTAGYYSIQLGGSNSSQTAVGGKSYNVNKLFEPGVTLQGLTGSSLPTLSGSCSIATNAANWAVSISVDSTLMSGNVPLTATPYALSALKAASSPTGGFNIYNGSSNITLTAPSGTTSYTFSFPTAAAAGAGYMLVSTDAVGGMGWQLASGGGSTGNYSFSANTLTTAAGDPVTILPGAASATTATAGNAAIFQGGPGGTTSGDGGSANIIGGTSTSGTGGVVSIKGGGTSSGSGGAVLISGASGNTIGAGGNVSITAGDGAGSNQNGGSVTITPGNAGAGGSSGAISLMGNVGIGTSAPLNQLDLYGSAETLSIQSTGLGNSSILSFANNSGKSVIFGGGMSNIYFESSDSNYPMFVDMTNHGLSIGSSYAYPGSYSSPSNGMIVQGNVGIGTTSPLSLLDVNGAIYANSICDRTGANCKTISGGWGGGTVTTNTGTANYLAYYSSGTSLNTSSIYVNGTSVGIGTTLPNANLEVRSTNMNDAVFGTTASSGLVNFYDSGTSLSPGIGSSGNNLILNTNGTTRITVTSSGYVGIGTTSPSYSLQVVGNAALSSGTSWINASDLRLKDIHKDYDKGLDEILKLHTVVYSYKKDNALGLPSDPVKTGVIAQEVQKVIPEAINTRTDGYLELNVDPIHWAMVNAVKEFYQRWFEDSSVIHRKLASQEADFAILKAENELLKNSNSALKAQNKAIIDYLCSKDSKSSICK